MIIDNSKTPSKRKVCYIDVETTGTNPCENDIIQLAYIIEIDDVVMEEGEMNVQPFRWDKLDPTALAVTGITVEQLKSFQLPQKAYVEFVRMLSKYVNKYDSSDKFSPAGYNVTFDVDFLKCFFDKNEDPYFGSFFNWCKVDPMYVLYWWRHLGLIELPNYKLSTVCKAFGIAIEAHKALSDIRATRELIKRIEPLLKKNLAQGANGGGGNEVYNK